MRFLDRHAVRRFFVMRLFTLAFALVACGLAFVAALPAQAQSQPQTQSQTPLAAAAPNAAASAPGPLSLTRSGAGFDHTDELQPGSLPAALIKLSDFEAYVQGLQGATLVRRLGIDWLANQPMIEGAASPLVPPDYLLLPGDEVVITLWGSIDADLHLVVDRSGRISIPRVGTIMVAGVRYGDLAEAVNRRVALVFKNYHLSVALGQLRGMRIYVTGFASKPGVFNVSGLSTVSQALQRAGGPANSGSFRDIQLRRGGRTVATFDFYDLLLKGDRTHDNVLQPDDVVHIGPIGPLVAMIGSVNRPAIYEIKPGDTVADVLRMAGGLSAVADTATLAIERAADRGGAMVRKLDLPSSSGSALSNGDVLRAFDSYRLKRSSVPNNKRIRVEGEVRRPGEYVLAPGTSVADALAAADGLTPNAFIYGTEFYRESVRQLQAQNYERALRDLETNLARVPASQRAATKDEAEGLSTSLGTSERLIEKLRKIQPTGRVVLQVTAESTNLPELALEDGDRIYVPPRPSTIGVFGSVFSTGSYLYSSGRTVADYLNLAGGPTRLADEDAVFVVRANGTVLGSLGETGWFARKNQINDLPTEPGDTVFVPDQVSRASWNQVAKDWTQVLYQFGLGIAGIRTAIK